MRSVLLATLLASLGAGAATAHADGAFTPAHVLASGRALLTDPALEITPGGSVRATWLATGTERPPLRGGGRATSPFGLPRFTPAVPRPAIGLGPVDLAGDGDGGVWVLATTLDPARPAMHIVHITAAGRIATRRRLHVEPTFTRLGGLDGSNGALAVNARGDVLAAWLTGARGTAGTQIMTAVHRRGKGWHVRPLGTAPNGQIGVGLSDAGAGALAFVHAGSVRVSVLSAGGMWGRPRAVARITRSSAQGPRVAVNDRRDLVVTWGDGMRSGETDEQPGPVEYFAAVAPAGRAFAPAATLHSAPVPTGYERILRPRAALSAGGHVVVAWGVSGTPVGAVPGSGGVFVRRGTLAAGLAPDAQRLTGSQDIRGLDLDAARSGRAAVVTWNEAAAEGRAAIRASIAARGAAFGSASTLVTISAGAVPEVGLVARVTDRRVAVGIRSSTGLTTTIRVATSTLR